MKVGKVVMAYRFIFVFLFLFSMQPVVGHDFFFTFTPSLRYFPNSPVSLEQTDEDVSLRISGYYESCYGENNLFLFQAEPFMHFSQNDHKLQHFDFRSLNIKHLNHYFNFALGFDKVHWGVMESDNIVDVINQIDFLESFVGKEKLGQPMARASFRSRTFGVVDFFLLPFFREQKYPGEKSRLRLPLPVSESVSYESARGKKHVDFASRWALSKNFYEVALSYFQGTRRNPDYALAFSSGGQLELQPSYPQLKQGGFELILIPSFALIKFEGVYSHTKQRSHTAHTIGLEKSLLNIFSTEASINTIIEYYRDNRQSSISSIYKNEIITGVSLHLNDINDTKFKVGMAYDLKSQQRVESIGFQRRLNQNILLALESRYIDKVKPDDYLYPFRKDSFIEVRLDYLWHPTQ
jgi:hypothetical protein